MNTQTNFLDLMESYKDIEAAPGKAFASVNASRLFHNDGPSIAQRRQKTTRYRESVLQMHKLCENAMKTRFGLFKLQEAMATSDFPQIFGDVIDRQLLANYIETPTTYQNWCKVGSVRDFRTVKRFRIDGGETYLAAVAQSAAYPESNVTDAEYTYSVVKYGRKMGFSWESMINDDLGALRDIPQRFGRASRRSIERYATTLVVDANGPHATVFATANLNQVNTTNGALSNNPVLGIVGLQDAFTVLGKQLDSEGSPIMIDTVELMVPPSLAVTARNILNATEIIVGADTATQRILTSNWMRANVRISVNPWIPLIASSANGSTSWLMFANPNNNRPGVEIGMLAGHEQPELFMRAPDAMSISGGGSGMVGSFDTDEVEYKVRFVFGGSVLDPKMMVASNGSGS